MFTSPYALTRDGFEQQFAVNYLGHFLLTHLLLPKLIQAGTNGQQPARIVSVSSSLSSLGWLKLDDLQAKYNYLYLDNSNWCQVCHFCRSFYNKWAAYGQSKVCQIMFTEMLNNLLSDSPVRSYALCPGAIRSNWYDNDLPSKIFIRIFGFLFKVFYTRLSKNFVHIKHFFKRARRKVRAASCLRPSHLSWSTRMGHFSKTAAWTSRHR